MSLFLKGAKLVMIVAIAIGLFPCTGQAAEEPKTNAIISDTKMTIDAWPTVYVLDSKGTIRLKLNGYGGKKTDALLDAVVDKLLEEAKG